jgi:hypothetical protein
MTSSETVLESSLNERIIEHFNAEITLGAITNIQFAMEWFKNTFLFIRMQKNPQVSLNNC